MTKSHYLKKKKTIRKLTNDLRKWGESLRVYTQNSTLFDSNILKNICKRND